MRPFIFLSEGNWTDPVKEILLPLAAPQSVSLPSVFVMKHALRTVQEREGEQDWPGQHALWHYLPYPC